MVTLMNMGNNSAQESSSKISSIDYVKLSYVELRFHITVDQLNYIKLNQIETN